MTVITGIGKLIYFLRAGRTKGYARGIVLVGNVRGCCEEMLGGNACPGKMFGYSNACIYILT